MQKTNTPSIVLIHGAWADGTTWQHVIPMLLDAGYHVTAVNIPETTSLADDVKIAQGVIDAQKGPVVVVGHSYGGMVMTNAAAGRKNVKALIFVNAFGPDMGETLTKLLGSYPATPLASAIVPDAAGHLYIDREKFSEAFAKDVDKMEERIMEVTQKPINGPIFDQSVTAVAWKDIPSWYLLGKQDNAIHPDLQRFMAKRMGAKITEIDASHVSYISQPKVTANLILEVAKMVAEGKVQGKQMVAPAV